MRIAGRFLNGARVPLVTSRSGAPVSYSASLLSMLLGRRGHTGAKRCWHWGRIERFSTCSCRDTGQRRSPPGSAWRRTRCTTVSSGYCVRSTPKPERLVQAANPAAHLQARACIPPDSGRNRSGTADNSRGSESGSPKRRDESGRRKRLRAVDNMIRRAVPPSRPFRTSRIPWQVVSSGGDATAPAPAPLSENRLLQSIMGAAPIDRAPSGSVGGWTRNGDIDGEAATAGADAGDAEKVRAPDALNVAGLGAFGLAAGVAARRLDLRFRYRHRCGAVVGPEGETGHRQEYRAGDGVVEPGHGR